MNLLWLLFPGWSSTRLVCSPFYNTWILMNRDNDFIFFFLCQSRCGLILISGMLWPTWLVSLAITHLPTRQHVLSNWQRKDRCVIIFSWENVAMVFLFLGSQLTDDSYLFSPCTSGWLPLHEDMFNWNNTIIKYVGTDKNLLILK